jgi:hypothetical protein
MEQFVIRAALAELLVAFENCPSRQTIQVIRDLFNTFHKIYDLEDYREEIP